jgi:hypothetical protein
VDLGSASRKRKDALSLHHEMHQTENCGVNLSWRRARAVRIHCPIDENTFAQLLKGDLAALELDPTAAKMLSVIRSRNPLGDFDVYQGVFEVSIGIEGFTATEGANPTAGGRGERTLSPTVIITTYVDAAADPAAVTAAIEALVEAHPWETPVIEVADGTVQLPERAPRRPV